MSTKLILKTGEAGLQEALKKLFATLLSEKCLDAILLPRGPELGSGVVPALVEDADKLEGIDIFEPVMPVNTASVGARISKGPVQEKIGFVLRPCEARAFTDLVKLKQATMEGVVIIGLDCPGTMPVKDYSKAIEEEGAKGTLALQRMKEVGEDGSDEPLRFACRICNTFTPENTALSIRFFGLDPEKEIVVEGEEAYLSVLKSAFSAEEIEEVQGQKELVEKIAARRQASREVALKEFKDKSGSLEGLVKMLAFCTNCRNCRVACPLCYCLECVFDSDIMRHNRSTYVQWAKKKGALRVPADTLMYHLTRMNHMITSCTQCGLCQAACPNEVEILKAFPLLAENLQGIFDYVPGRSLQEDVPLATFREEELEVQE